MAKTAKTTTPAKTSKPAAAKPAKTTKAARPGKATKTAVGRTAKPARPSKPAAAKSTKAAKPEVDRFEGFGDADMKFFRALAKHQDRDWFAEHKSEYEECWARPMAALLAELRAAIDRAYPDCELGEPKVFRIYRDVRFGADKSPFKTHVSGVLSAKSGHKVTESPAAFYLQLGTETFAGAGLYMMDPRQLSQFRAALLDDERGAEVAKMVERLQKVGWSVESAESLKSAPRGIDPAHPRVDLLKRKGLIVGFPEIPKELITKRGLLDWMVAQAKAAAPLVRWLVYNTV